MRNGVRDFLTGMLFNAQAPDPDDFGRAVLVALHCVGRARGWMPVDVLPAVVTALASRTNAPRSAPSAASAVLEVSMGPRCRGGRASSTEGAAVARRCCRRTRGLWR